MCVLALYLYFYERASQRKDQPLLSLCVCVVERRQKGKGSNLFCAVQVSSISL